MSARVRTPFTEAFRQAFEDRDPGTSSAAREGRAVSGRRSVVHGSMSENDLQRLVTHDLGVLMNTVNFAAGTDISAHPHIRTSVLNYGFPDMVHRSIDEVSVNDIGDEIETALAAFEPRLVPGSVGVIRDTRVSPDQLRIRFIVSAELDCEPLNVPVRFVADLERDTGKIVIQRR
ncbi:hypothetical protein OPKNFCMD_0474 [Methylobacterium crusticola]|uniref:IraD/Gp25-like domain-containing protein n=1 Tax=Methylobacterium crusticola TaxID=1697972 RepID=A0ABQ4QST0_9HYPH|nr:GPW/gp25 family protein [Methylobacterium crusticola]GJD47764.1 hypothetical protein OPKNFCMD_0474 [Methylobacterium crusticola]